MIGQLIPGTLLADKSLAKALGVCRSRVWVFTKAGLLPPPIKLAGSTRWVSDQIIEKIAELTEEAKMEKNQSLSEICTSNAGLRLPPTKTAIQDPATISEICAGYAPG